MANRNFFSDVKTNVPDVIEIHFSFTGSDTANPAYTVVNGGKYISAVTRSAEGATKIALKDRYKKFLGINIVPSIADHTPYVSAVDVDAASPYVTVTWQKFSAAASTSDDLQNSTVYGTLYLQASGLGYL